MTPTNYQTPFLVSYRIHSVCPSPNEEQGGKDVIIRSHKRCQLCKQKVDGDTLSIVRSLPSRPGVLLYPPPSLAATFHCSPTCRSQGTALHALEELITLNSATSLIT